MEQRDQPSSPGRRDFLKKVAKVALAGVAGTFVGIGGKEAIDAVNRLDEEQGWNVRPMDVGHGITLYHQYGRPYYLQMADGHRITIDKGVFIQAQELARQTRKPQLTAWVDLGETSLTEYTQKPLIEELPRDVLTREGLLSRGIEIITPDGIELYIRQQAFAEDGLMARYSKNAGNKLIIALVDSPQLTPESFANPRYQKLQTVIDLFFKEHPVLTPDEIRKKQIEYIRTTPGMGGNTYTEIAIWEKMPDEKIIAAGLTSSMYGQYYPPKDGPQGVGLPGTTVIFVAAGEQPRPRTYLAVFADTPFGESSFYTRFGTISMFNRDVIVEKIPSYSPNNSFPEPGSFARYILGKPKSQYNIGRTTVGFTLRHELAHDVTRGNESESNTDIRALKTIAQASELLRQGKNDAGYFLVLKRDQDRHFILTGDRSNHVVDEKNT